MRSLTQWHVNAVVMEKASRLSKTPKFNHDTDVVLNRGLKTSKATFASYSIIKNARLSCHTRAVDKQRCDRYSPPCTMFDLGPTDSSVSLDTHVLLRIAKRSQHQGELVRVKHKNKEADDKYVSATRCHPEPMGGLSCKLSNILDLVTSQGTPKT